MILQVKNLKKTFKQNLKKIEVLKGVDLSMNSGEIFGFIGPNGAGKTTSLKCILDFVIPTEGEIKIFGKELKNNREILKDIGFAPEQAYYYDHLTGEEFLYFMGNLSGLKKKQLKIKTEEILEKVGLSFAGKRYIKTYSKGMKQRLGIGSSIIHDPKLVFFDEPMSGLDPLGRNLVKNIILDLKKNGTAVFFNTHILSDVQQIADRFSIINKGKIIYTDETKNVKLDLENFFVQKIEQDSENIEIK